MKQEILENLDALDIYQGLVAFSPFTQPLFLKEISIIK